MANGMGCKCEAKYSGECCCEGVDWTPQEVVDLKKKVEELEELKDRFHGWYVKELNAGNAKVRLADLQSRLDEVEQARQRACKDAEVLATRLDLAEKDRETIQLIADDGLENLKKMKVRLDLVVEALKKIHLGLFSASTHKEEWMKMRDIAKDTLAKLKEKPYV